MFKKFGLFIATSILFSNTVLANCLPNQKQPTDTDYADQRLSLYLQDETIIDKINATYCFQRDYYLNSTKNQDSIILVAKTPKQVDYFLDKGLSIDTYNRNKTPLDLLSHYLLIFNTSNALNAEETALINNLQKKYNPGKPLKKVEQISSAKRADLLNYISTVYYKKSISTHVADGYTPWHFAVLTSDYYVLDNLIGNSKTYSSKKVNLYKKNKYGVTPFHMAFGNKIPFDKSTAKVNLEKTNDFLLANLDPARIKFLSINGKSFFEFAHLMKDSNTDFYNKLLKTYKFPQTSGILPSVEKQTRDSFVKLLNVYDINSLEN